MLASRSPICLFRLLWWLMIAALIYKATGSMLSNPLFGALSETGNLMDLGQSPVGSLTNQMLGKPVRSFMSQLMSPKESPSATSEQGPVSDKTSSSEPSTNYQASGDSNGESSSSSANSKPVSGLIDFPFLKVPPVFVQPGKLPNPLEATATLFNLTKGSFFGKISGLDKVVKPESEAVYYDRAPNSNPLDEDRKPKYFSHECNFRISCEVGKLMRPVAQPLSKIVATNKVIQDLQNRYTRAMTYGFLHNSCERYYCLMVELMGGPTKFASGLVELLNRLANPDLYELYES